MFSPKDVDDDGTFAACETSAEVLLAVHHLFGLGEVERLLIETSSSATKEGLRRDADQLALVGLRELAGVVRRHARKAKAAPRKFGRGYQTASALAWIEHRRAERERSMH
jgi:hypothetical protein